MTASPTAPAAVPSEDDIARVIEQHIAPMFGSIDSAAAAVLALFAPILAEKGREIASAWSTYEDSQMHADHWVEKFAAAEARALAAEAALATAREDAITAYACHIDVALREYDDNLSYGDDALGPEFFIERGMERAAASIRAQIAAHGAAMEARDD